MKSGLWLSQRQVRWLIVLLALLPLIPTVFLVQTIIQNAVRDRDMAVGEITAIYRNQLSLIVERFSVQTDSVEGLDLERYLRQIFGEDVRLKVVDQESWFLEELPKPFSRDTIIYEVMGGTFAGWTILLDGVPVFPDHIEEQAWETIWPAIVIVFGVTLAAGGVWYTVHRRLRVDSIRSDLITTISHEIKTPVAAMKILIETLEEGQLDEVSSREYLRLLDKENERIRELADQFLTFSRLERGLVTIQKIDCRFEKLVEEQAELFRPQFEAVEGSVEILTKGEIEVHTDPKAVKVVIANLLANGLKYGGAPPRVTLELTEDSRHARLEVSDNGEGIPRSESRAVFQRFYRGDARLSHGKAGVGLGLAISRRFMKLLGGSIYSENPENEGGARLVLTLPLISR